MTHDTPDLDTLLATALDPEAAPEARAAAEARLGAHPLGARRLAEHRALWDALGELDPAGGFGDGAFVERVRARARDDERRARALRRLRAAAPALAASLLVFAGALGWLGHRAWAAQRDEQLVRYLHLVEHADFVQSHAAALDLRTEFEVRRAFQGELDER